MVAAGVAPLMATPTMGHTLLVTETTGAYHAARETIVRMAGARAGYMMVVLVTNPERRPVVVEGACAAGSSRCSASVAGSPSCRWRGGESGFPSAVLSSKGRQSRMRSGPYSAAGRRRRPSLPLLASSRKEGDASPRHSLPFLPFPKLRVARSNPGPPINRPVSRVRGRRRGEELL
jgi:hypothetical protein